MKILAVLVVYNKMIRETTTYRSLAASVNASVDKNDVCLIVYDNSKVAQYIDINNSIITHYLHDSTNGGLSKAYNYALDYALKNSIDWLLLLDQDSDLEVTFFSKVLNDISRVQDDDSVSAIVPKVYSGNTLISPFFVGIGGTFKAIRRFDKNYAKNEIGAINSGSLIRVSYLEAVGGFNAAFWLDMLDHWLFHTIYTNKKKIVISDNVVGHNLSVLEYSSIDDHRYNNIIAAEVIYYKNYKPTIDSIVFKFRLVFRCIKLLFIRKRPSLAMLTFKRLFS